MKTNDADSNNATEATMSVIISARDLANMTPTEILIRLRWLRVKMNENRNTRRHLWTMRMLSETSRTWRALTAWEREIATESIR